ncbi:MAG TPA: hypothetical protein VL361_03585 [Candidatus Limnocylindrales bacterium]|jgi:hypothetical protein|nr:hypothetical protein [Candidatus Limnocylindrales bacterium]
MKIICSGHMVRYPLAGQSWHHLQYLVGLKRLGHEVIFFEHFGWPDACYDPVTNTLSPDPTYGIAYVNELLRPHGLENSWCYLSEDGSSHGLSREALHQACREADLYLNISNINWIPELEDCRCRVLIDTDPVFTQIGAHGMGGPFTRYHRLFTYGENVHRPGCEMPTAHMSWLPTRQPVVPDCWPVSPGQAEAPFTTIMNSMSFAPRRYQGRFYGQKDIEFEPFLSLPLQVEQPMEIALNAPKEVRKRAVEQGWRLADPRKVTQTPTVYQSYLSSSHAEFSVAKHGYVSTSCGWFSDRSTGYLATGRPVVVQDTGFSRVLPTGLGLLSFSTHTEALQCIEKLQNNYDDHCRAARQLVEEYFDAPKVLTDLLEQCF